MVVAARAAQCDAEKRGAHHVGHLGQNFVAAAGHFLVAGVLAQRTQAIEAGRDQRLLLIRPISSPASCSTMNRSYGLSLLNERMT